VTSCFAPTDRSLEILKSIAEELLGVPSVTLESINVGGNSRVYRVIAASRCYALKTYFHHASDGRARMETEFESLTFLWRSGERSVPAPVAAVSEQHCAIYEWIGGEKFLPGDVSEAHIDAATAFLARLAVLKHRPGANHLRPASEACFSGRTLAECLRGRVEPLLARSDHAELADFLHRDLLPALGFVLDWSRSRLGDMFERELAPGVRTLSPSDFGFHNALRRGDGTPVFLDFEYFGWDDPAKMICDFLLHPGMSVPPALKRAFATAMLREFPEAAGRVEAYYPLFGLKWCLILLNEFLPTHLLRRKFAGLKETEARQAEQLAKARTMLRSVVTDDHRFPYGD
jgi:hypothetical protein